MSHKAKKIVLGFIIVILLGGITADYLTMHQMNRNHVSRVNTTEFVTISNIIAALAEKLTASYPALQMMAVDQTNTVGYQNPGESFQTILPTNDGALTFKDSQGTSETDTFNYYISAFSFVSGYLHSEGYTSLPSSATNSQVALLSKVGFYESSSNICQITAYTLLDITCVPRTQVSANDALTRTLIRTYRAVAPNNGTISLTAPQLSASLTPGYHLAVLDVYTSNGETKLNYYQQGTGAWQLVNLEWYNDPHQDGSVTPNCEDFESVPAVEAAYKGQTCYNSTTRTMASVN